MIKLHTQQGDCILEVVSEIPESAKEIKAKGNFILLKGEGVNTHEITNAEEVKIFEDNGTLYLKSSKSIELIHSEHGKMVLEPNKIYRRRIEREFDYESMEARNTQD